MKIHSLIKSVEKTLRDNSPGVLTALGVSGTITTAYLAGKASFQAARVLHGEDVDPWPTTRQQFEMVWKLYIPPAVSGVITIGCIVSATKIGNRRTAALTAAYSLSERAFAEYREKVVEKLGENKEQALRDEINTEKILRNAPSREVVLVGAGNILCCELYSGRYFNSDMETLRKAQNDINAKLVRDNDATINDFYYLVGLPPTLYSGEMGWDSDKLLELSFTTALTEDSRPCLAFEYNYVKPFFI